MQDGRCRRGDPKYSRPKIPHMPFRVLAQPICMSTVNVGHPTNFSFIEYTTVGYAV